jgi:membrane-bound lytic murein transglycosylase D
MNRKGFRIALLTIISAIALSANAQVSGPLISHRLDSIQDKVELDYNGEVKSLVLDYIKNSGNKTNIMLENFLQVDSELQQIFRSYNLPVELRYVCISLSNCDNFVKDSEGKSGYFKMRYNVAKRRGLRITNYIDERRDILKSAAAFCEEISSIQRGNQDWKTTITQYSSGNLEWAKAVSISGDSTSNFWNVYKHLPYTYRMEYPRFVAATYIANYYHKHGLKPSVKHLDTGTVQVMKLTTLYQLSSKLDVDYELVKTLNPIYKKEIIPNSGKKYFVVIPKNKVKVFIEMGDEVYNYAKVDHYNNTEVKVIDSQQKDPVVIPKVVDPKPVPEKKWTTISYTVRSGDVLIYIADYYDCRVSDLKRWNNLTRDRINVNQRLKVQVPTKRLDYYQKINRMTSAQKKKIAASD